MGLVPRHIVVLSGVIGHHLCRAIVGCWTTIYGLFKQGRKCRCSIWMVEEMACDDGGSFVRSEQSNPHVRQEGSMLWILVAEDLVRGAENVILVVKDSMRPE